MRTNTSPQLELFHPSLEGTDCPHDLGVDAGMDKWTSELFFANNNTGRAELEVCFCHPLFKLSLMYFVEVKCDEQRPS